MKMLKNLFKAARLGFISVHADTAPVNNPTNPDNPPANTVEPPANKPQVTPETEALIAAARKQEKDKLYPEITTLKEQNKTLQTEMTGIRTQFEQAQAALIAATEALKEAQKAPPAPAPAAVIPPAVVKEEPPVPTENPEIKRLTDLVSSLTGSMQTLTTKVEDQSKESARRDAEAAEAALASYRAAAVAAAGLPAEFAPLVQGKNQEEVNASINTLRQGVNKMIPTPVAERRSGSLLTSGVRMPGAPNQNAVVQADEITADMVANMNPQEYAQFRSNNPNIVGGGQRYGFNQGFGGGLRRQ